MWNLWSGPKKTIKMIAEIDLKKEKKKQKIKYKSLKSKHLKLIEKEENIEN